MNASAKNSSEAAEVRIEVRYRGKAVDSGRMSAVDLGPAIFGLGKAVEETGRILYGPEAMVRVEVEAHFRAASFGLDCYAVSESADLLLGLSWEQIGVIVAVLGFNVREGIKDVLGLLRRQNRRAIENVVINGDVVTFNFHGDAPDQLTLKEYRTLTDSEVRGGLRAMLSPLEREGVDSVELKADGAEPVLVGKEDMLLFEAPAGPIVDQAVSVDTGRAVLEVVGPIFKADNMWLFSQGGSEFKANIADRNFLREVGSHRLLFGAGDAIIADVETTTNRSNGRLSYRRKILRVHKHIQGDGSHNQLDILDAD